MIKNKEKGFTLIELMIVMLMIALVASVTFGQLAPIFEFNKREQTKLNMKNVIKSFENVYLANQYNIEKENAANMQVLIGTNTFNIPNGSVTNIGLSDEETCFLGTSPLPNCGEGCKSLLNNFNSGTPISEQKGYLLDGFGNPFLIYVSNPLFQVVDGIQIFYKKVYLVSSNGVLHETGSPLYSSKYDPVDDILTVSEQDLVMVFNGFEKAYSAYLETKKRLNLLADSYSTFFNSRFLSSVDKAVDIDYFAGDADPASGWDANNTDPLGANPIPKVTNFSLRTDTLTNGMFLYDFFGLSEQETVNGWGKDIILDNSSSLVRNPSGVAGKQTAPFTAQFYTKMPDPSPSGTGSKDFVVTAVGKL